MLHWNLTKYMQCLGSALNQNIQNFANEFKTNLVMVKPVTDANKTYIIEVWFNFNGYKYIIVVYEKPEFYEDGLNTTV